MPGLRFDPALPVIATSAFDAGDLKVEAGTVFDWRARGLTEIDAVALFSTGLLAHKSLEPSTTAPAPVKQQARPARR